MDRDAIVACCLTRYMGESAFSCACKILHAKSLPVLFEVLESIDELEIPMKQRNTVLFRASYLLENCYWLDSCWFVEFLGRFNRLFVGLTNESAKRHFAKIQADLLSRGWFPDEFPDEVAQRCAEWIVQPGVRSAVQVWAMEVLFLLRGRVDWVSDVIVDLIASLSCDPSPAIRSRLKRWCGYLC